MHKPVKYVEKAVTLGARGAWVVFDRLNRVKQNPSPTPKWSDKPLLKSYEKSKPPLGWPRATDSLCPKCVPEIRQQILDGHLPYEVLMNEKVGEIKATIIERDGKILMVKECPTHGRFEDVMSIDTEFSQHLEDVFPGRDIKAHNDEKLHHHGTSTVKYGRGSVLTIDLTNRCSMMYDPCFMDANQVACLTNDMGRNQDHARQRDYDQAAASDEHSSPAASRRCPVLLGRSSLCAEGWIQPVQPRPAELNAEELRFGSKPLTLDALCVSQFDAHRQRRQRPPQSRQPV
jgi:hypothetical protein